MTEIDNQHKAHNYDEERHNEALARQSLALLNDLCLFLLNIIDGCQLQGGILFLQQNSCVKGIAQFQSHGHDGIDTVSPQIGSELRQDVSLNIVECELHVIMFHLLIKNCKLVGSLAPTFGHNQIACCLHLAIVGFCIVGGKRFIISSFSLFLLTQPLQTASLIEVQTGILLVNKTSCGMRMLLVLGQHII